jgi:hypothetical protein
MTAQEPAAVRKPSHYQVLMVDPCVDDDVLTEVYRRLVQRARTADLEEGRRARVLRAMERAYAVLHDPVRRTLYDIELEECDGAETAPRRQVVVPVAAAPKAISVPVSEDPQPVTTLAARSTATAHATPAVRPTPTVRPTQAATPTAPSASTAGSRIIDFGRYAGWTLRQIALRDRDYLEWLRRTPGGRQYQAEIASILAPR